MRASVSAYFDLAVEGVVDKAVGARLLADQGAELRTAYIKNGKGQIDAKLPAYNAAARHSAWLVLRDLDFDAACAPALARAKLPRPAPFMAFRIAVREIEAWLLADCVNLGTFLGISMRLIWPVCIVREIKAVVPSGVVGSMEWISIHQNRIVPLP